MHLILCFCVLPQDQVQDVLDAMFEKTVESGDYVIRQGDDGDNFYVIDRYITQRETNGAQQH